MRLTCWQEYRIYAERYSPLVHMCLFQDSCGDSLCLPTAQWAAISESRNKFKRGTEASINESSCALWQLRIKHKCCANEIKEWQSIEDEREGCEWIKIERGTDIFKSCPPRSHKFQRCVDVKITVHSLPRSLLYASLTVGCFRFAFSQSWCEQREGLTAA